MGTGNELKSILRKAMPSLYQRLQEVLIRCRVSYVNRSLTSRIGWVVNEGPFVGMRYVSEAVGSTLSPKLLGSYEAELHPTIDVILKNNYQTVIDIGCAEGYYAVGLALKLPRAVVYAFDINPNGRELCSQMSRANAVEDRVIIHGECNHKALRTLATPGSLIICDCEGCEWELLEPSLIPELANCDLLVELHDLFRPGLTDEMISRFASSHEIALVNSQDRDPSAYPLIKGFTRLNQRVAVGESRDGQMQWAFMRSKHRGPGT